jgi:hypothetical protein
MLINQLENPFANSRRSNEEFGLLALSHIKYLEAANEDEAYSDLLVLLKPPDLSTLVQQIKFV